MITTVGKEHIRRVLAGQVSQTAKAISFGIGSAAAAVGDTRLQFEVARVPLKNTSIDSSNRIVFKCTVPDNLNARITEVGLWSELTGGTDLTIVTFDEDEVWDNTPVFSTSTPKIGPTSLRQAPSSGASADNQFNTGGLDLSNYSAADSFVLAYNTNANTASIKVQFKTDDSNYFEGTVTNPATGYHFDTLVKGTLSATGSPRWSEINSVKIITTAKAAVASQVDFDGLKVVDVDTVDPNYVLVARQVISSYDVQPGTTNDHEYRIEVTL